MGISVLSPASEDDVTSDLNFSLDIIAIHGLNGDKFRTWTEPTSQKLWLRDFLPNELPRARVMTFGYNATAAFENSKAGIREHARHLLVSLMEKRGDISASKRPLILMGHSLGGLVLKQALIIAQHEPLYLPIYSSVRGVIFFGTPHQGSSLANYATILSRVPLILANKPRPQLLEALRKESGELKLLTENFKTLLNAKAFSVVSFYETRTLNGWKALVVEKTSALLTPPNDIPTYEEQIPADATHRDICRFSSRENETYIAAVRSIKRLYQKGDGVEIVSEYFIVPNSSNVQFTGRLGIRERLSELVVTSAYAESQQRFVLYGMGGSGKTQICLKFAEDHRKKFWGIFWLDASTTETVQASFLKIARKCKLEESIEAVKLWLSAKSSWLLIIDNADDPDLDIKYYFPSGTNGTVIITTRNPESRNVASAGSYRVDEMEHEDAVALLLKTISPPDPDGNRNRDRDIAKARKSAEATVKILGHLALAIIQAGAVIRQQICTLDDFCALYSQRKKELLELGRSRPDMEEYQYSVFTTWEISIRKIEEMSQSHAELALELLRLFSFIHFDGIEASLFRSARENSEGLETGVFESSLLMRVMPSGWDQILWGRAIGILVAFSLVSVNGSGSVSLHPLVHEWSRERMSGGEKKAAWEVAAMTLSASITRLYTFDDSQQRRKTLPHIDALLLHDNGQLLEEGPRVMPRSIAAQKFMMAYHEGQRTEKALNLGLQNLKAITPILPPSDRHILVLQINIATQLYASHRYTDAISIHTSLLDLATTTSDTELYLSACTGLGGNYIALCRYEDALAIAKLGVSKAQAQAETANHTDTDTTITTSLLLSLHEIQGLAYINLSNIPASLACAEEVFLGRKTVYGEKHLHTLSAMGNLVAALEGSGFFDRAWDIQEQLLGLMRESLGTGHPKTKDAVCVLANFPVRVGLKRAGGRARKMWMKALVYREEVLRMMEIEFGEGSLCTIRYRAEFAMELYKAGMFERALEVQEGVVRGFEELREEESVGENPVMEKEVEREKRDLDMMRKAVKVRKVVGWLVPGKGV